VAARLVGRSGITTVVFTSTLTSIVTSAIEAMLRPPHRLPFATKRQIGMFLIYGVGAAIAGLLASRGAGSPSCHLWPLPVRRASTTAPDDRTGVRHETRHHRWGRHGPAAAPFGHAGRPSPCRMSVGTADLFRRGRLGRALQIRSEPLAAADVASLCVRFEL